MHHHSKPRRRSRPARPPTTPPTMAPTLLPPPPPPPLELGACPAPAWASAASEAPIALAADREAAAMYEDWAAAKAVDADGAALAGSEVLAAKAVEAEEAAEAAPARMRAAVLLGEAVAEESADDEGELLAPAIAASDVEATLLALDRELLALEAEEELRLESEDDALEDALDSDKAALLERDAELLESDAELPMDERLDADARDALAIDADSEARAPVIGAELDDADAALEPDESEDDAALMVVKGEGMAGRTRGRPHPPERGGPLGKTAGSTGIG
jgi:hypothetical protein